jgi:hypothetical protein
MKRNHALVVEILDKPIVMIIASETFSVPSTKFFVYRAALKKRKRSIRVRHHTCVVLRSRQDRVHGPGKLSWDWLILGWVGLDSIVA